MKIAVIGGSLPGEMQGFSKLTGQPVQTPYGEPSGIITNGSISNNEVIYLNRHGHSHNIAPHQVNYRANMYALKMLDVTHVIAITAVGGISKIMSPMRWVVPDQIIDYTWGREQSYNEYDEKAVNHIDFTCPFDETTRSKLQQAVTKANKMCIAKAVYGVTQGPRLETAAEIKRMKKDGCDIVGMTAMPEAALARELELNYATLSLVVNWAAGRGEDAEVVSIDEMGRRIAKGNKQVHKIIKNAVSLF